MYIYMNILCIYIYIDSTSICKPFREKSDLAGFGKTFRLRWTNFIGGFSRKICQACTEFTLTNGSSSFPNK